MLVGADRYSGRHRSLWSRARPCRGSATPSKRVTQQPAARRSQAAVRPGFSASQTARGSTLTRMRSSRRACSSRAQLARPRASSGWIRPDDDVERIVSRIEHRLTRVLDRWRATRNEDGDAYDEPLLPACAEVPPTELVRVMGPNEPTDRRPAPKKPLCARSPGGLELHAEVTTAAQDRNGLERLCRYLTRPPIPQDRLERRSDGKLVLSLERIHCGARGAAPVGSRPEASQLTNQERLAASYDEHQRGDVVWYPALPIDVGELQYRGVIAAGHSPDKPIRSR